MGLNKGSALKYAVPALAFFLGSSLLVAGGGQQRSEQREQEVPSVVGLPGDETSGVDHVVTAADCTYLQDPDQYQYDREASYALRSDQMNRVTRVMVSLDGSSTNVQDASTVVQIGRAHV
mgnify:CR=1 FL=1